MPGKHSGAWFFDRGMHGLNLSPDGDAERFLDRYGKRVLVARRDGEHAEILIYDRSNGLWSRDPDLFLGLHNEALQAFSTRFQKAEAEEGALRGFSELQRKRVPQLIQARQNVRAADDMAKAIGALVQQVIDRGESETVTWWDDIAVCRHEDIDADMGCIAAPNGVIDLKDGKLLRPLDGKQKLCTTHNALPDPYRPEAVHPDVDRLVAHMPEEHANYFWDEFGYSLHGRPTRRVLMVISPPGSGKTTMLRALTHSLGPLAGRPPREAIAQTKMSRDAADPHGFDFAAPKRLAIMEEVERVRVSADVLKERSGDSDSIKPRMLYGNPVSVEPTATMLLFGNSVPQQLGLSDPAVLQRMRPLPYLPIPKEDRDPKLMDAFHKRNKTPEEALEATSRRQALVARLVQRAVTYQRGNPPSTPPEVAELVASWEDDEIGEVGRWLVDSFVPEPGGYIVVDDLWNRLAEEFGEETDGRIQGWQRSTFTRRIKAMIPELPPATRLRSNGRKRGWAGWTFRPPGDDIDDIEYEQAEREGQEMFL